MSAPQARPAEPVPLALIVPLGDPETIRKALAVATAFSISIFIGPKKGYFRTETSSLASARDLMEPIERIVGNRRYCMVYALTPDGRCVFVPRGFEDGGR